MAGAQEKKASQGPLEEPKDMHSEAQMLRELAEVPAISAAWVAPALGHIITVQYAQRDLAANRVRKFLRTFHLPERASEEQVPVTLSFPIEQQDVVLHSVSPSGKRQLVVKKAGDATTLEIWAGGRLVKERQAPKELHGAVYNDNWFGTGAAWSADESRIAYVAEVPQSVRTPDYGAEIQAAGQAATDSKAKAVPKSWRGYGEFQEDWGERNTGKRTPGIFVLEVASGEVQAVQGLPADASFGQPVWEPDGAGLVVVSWPHKSSNFPRLTQRLGIVYCLNRPAYLHRVRLSPAAEAEQLETGLDSALCPRFSPDGRALVFLSHNAAVTSGAHCASATLEQLRWPPEAGAVKRRTLIGVVERPDDERAFPGLFSFQPGVVPFGFISSDRLLITSFWRSTRRILEVTLDSGDGPASVSAVTPADGATPAWTLLAVGKDLAVASHSGPGRAPALAVSRLGSGGSSIQWQHITAAEEAEYSPRLAAFLEPSRTAYHTLRVKPSTAPTDIGFEAVLLPSLSGKKAAPTVLSPHGGPHTAFAAEYVLSNAFFNILGYNVIQVNYRGSLGFGEDSVQSLPGKAGTNDVEDCMESLKAAIDAGWVEKDRVAVIGGSHGGFLTGHLLGQHPQSFKAGVLRNPVLDVALMTQITDIPDWCFIEGFGSEEGLKRASVKPTSEELRQLTEKSPIHHIHRVTAPMFFMLGAKDRRVVMRDTQQYVSALRARPDAPESRVIVFPEDSHGLELPQTEFEQWLNAAWWLCRFV